MFNDPALRAKAIDDILSLLAKTGHQGVDLDVEALSVASRDAYQVALAQAGKRDPITTEIVAAPPFYFAEDYHQQYYELNNNTNPYCRIVIQPKLEKFRKVFHDKLKPAQ